MSVSTHTRRASTPSSANVSTRARAIAQNAPSRWSSRTSRPSPVDGHADRVEADLLEVRPLAPRAGEPDPRHPPHLRALAGVEVVPGQLPPRTARLDLAEDERTAIDGDEVELTQPRLEVARDDAPAEALDVRGGELLSQPAEGLRAHDRRRYGRRRHGSARECHNFVTVVPGQRQHRPGGAAIQPMAAVVNVALGRRARSSAHLRTESVVNCALAAGGLASAALKTAAPARARAAGTPSTGSSSGAAARRPGARSPPGARASSSRRACRTPTPGSAPPCGA